MAYKVVDCCDSTKYYSVDDPSSYGTSDGDVLNFWDSGYVNSYCGTVDSTTTATQISGTYELYDLCSNVGGNDCADCDGQGTSCADYFGAGGCPDYYIVQDCCYTSIYYKVVDTASNCYGPFSSGDIISWYGEGKYSNPAYHCGTVVADTGQTITDPSGNY